MQSKVFSVMMENISVKYGAMTVSYFATTSSLTMISTARTYDPAFSTLTACPTPDERLSGESLATSE